MTTSWDPPVGAPRRPDRIRSTHPLWSRIMLLVALTLFVLTVAGGIYETVATAQNSSRASALIGPAQAKVSAEAITVNSMKSDVADAQVAVDEAQANYKSVYGPALTDSIFNPADKDDDDFVISQAQATIDTANGGLSGAEANLVSEQTTYNHLVSERLAVAKRAETVSTTAHSTFMTAIIAAISALVLLIAALVVFLVVQVSGRGRRSA